MANNKGIFSLIFKIFDKFVDIRVAYNDIKSNPEAKKTSTVLAKRSILYSIIGAVVFAISFALIFWGFSLVDSASVFFGIMLIILGISMIFYPLAFLILSLNLVIKQLLLNKKPLGFIALSIFLLMIALIVVGVILTFTYLG